MTPYTYFQIIKDLTNKADPAAAEQAVEVIYQAMENKKTIFVAGNGGSAATANHFAADFGKNVVKGNKNRPRIMSLCCNMGSLTAYANDEGYDQVFARQMTNWAEAGDVLVVISASGNSQNAVNAAKLMQKLGGKVIAMTGFSGGALKELADVSLHIPENRYETVEDIHSVFCHMIVSCIKERVNV